MTEKKAFLLRLDKAVWTALDRLARMELRSVNAQIEYVLRETLRKAGRLKTPEPRDKKEGAA